MSFLIQTYHFYFENFEKLYPSVIEIVNFFNLILLIYLLTQIGKYLFQNSEPALVNFFLGWIVFYYFLFIGNWFFNLSLSLLAKLFFITILIILVYKKIINISQFKKFDYKVLIILSPYFLVLLSMKTVEWDSFAFWIYQTDYLINNKTFINSSLGEMFHHASYPQAKNILISSSTIITGISSENLPSIFSLVILYLLANFFYKQKKQNNYFLLFITFCTPILITDKIFSHYHDFILGVSILVAVYILSKKKFLLSFHTQSIKNIFLFGLVISLIPINKNVGIIHLFSILSCFLFLSLYQIKFEKKIFSIFMKRFLLLIVIVLTPWILWKIYIITAGLNLDEYSKFGHHGFRFYIFSEIITSALKQIFERKIALLIIFFPILIILFRSSFDYKKEAIFYLFILGVWIIFLNINYLTNFPEMNARKASSFYRYLYQVVPLALYIFVLYLNSLNTDFINKKLKLFNKLIIFLILIFPLFFISKIRKDLNPLYYDAYLAAEEIIYHENKNNNKYLIISDYPSIQKEIIAYYSNISKENIIFNSNSKYDFEIVIDDLKKINERRSYILNIDDQKKIYIND